MTGKFRAGGGDTTKPISEERRKEMARKGIVAVTETAASRRAERMPRIKGEAQKYPRVAEMFRLPVGERWAVAKDFTAEEAAYARRLAKRALSEEKRMDEICSWDGCGDETPIERYSGISGGSLGESDDGSV